MLIEHLKAGLHETGKIKIGRKGEKYTTSNGKTARKTIKMDYFVVTTNERGADDNFIVDQPVMDALAADYMAAWREKNPDASAEAEAAALLVAGKPRSLGVQVLFDRAEDNMDLYLGRFPSGRCVCRRSLSMADVFGDIPDGLAVDRSKPGTPSRVASTKCPCPYLDNGKSDGCKMHGALLLLLDKAQSIGGVHKFRTTGKNSIKNTLAGLGFILMRSNGILAGLPLRLTLSLKQTATPPDGKMGTIQVVTISYPGPLDSLRASALQIAQIRAQSQLQMSELRKSLRLITAQDSPDDEAEVAEEFHPEEPVAEEPTVVLPTGERVDAETGELPAEDAEFEPVLDDAGEGLGGAGSDVAPELPARASAPAPSPVRPNKANPVLLNPPSRPAAPVVPARRPAAAPRSSF